MSFNRRRWGVFACLAASVAVFLLSRGAGTPAQAAPQGAPEADPAVERTREQVKMLDDLYKNAVVSITRKYVAEQDIQPAIMVAKEVFGVMEKKGWHSARLVDATGEPINEENAPKTAFEKEAYKAIRSGETYFEQVVGQGKDRHLLAATLVPVVLKRCGDCHAHRKVGEVLGFIRYDVPVK